MNSIDIRTTQNVIIEYELAALRDRFIALLIDVIIIGVTWYGIVFLAIEFGGFYFDRFLDTILGLLPLLGLIIYQLCMEIFSNGQSIGKKALGLKVVRIDGQEPSLGDYLLRAVFHLIDTFFSLGIIGALMISSSDKNQRLGDMTANTTVIKKKSSQQFKLSDIMTINTIEDYEPIYLEVKNLDEKDMLLVKSTLLRYRNHPNNAHLKAIDALTARLTELMEIKEIPVNKIDFLKTLIKDYIVLTR